MTTLAPSPPLPPARPGGAPTDSRTGAPPSALAERTLRLCALLAEHGRPMSLAEITQQSGLPKGSVHRLCTYLVSAGYLQREVDERFYAIGPALRALAFDVLNHGSLRGQRHDVLRHLVQEIGETCNFTTLDGTEVLYLDRVEARWPLRLTIDVGTRVPLHCTASGKLFLALMMSRRQRNIVIDRLALDRMTAATITDAATLRAECDEIATRGHALDREEFVAGLVSIAVPVLDGGGKVRAAIAVHAPAVRLSLADAEARRDVLARAAARMGGLL
ncbi:MAG: IclR family transcriptional regulator [Burkholderiaceae bacterium]